MRGFDKTHFIGRLTADPVRKATKAGKELAEFSVAVDRGFGEQKTTVFYRCTVWGNAVEAVMMYAKKGDWIGVEGQVTATAYIAKDGTPKASLNVTVDNFLLMRTKTAQTEEDFVRVQDEDNPF